MHYNSWSKDLKVSMGLKTLSDIVSYSKWCNHRSHFYMHIYNCQTVKIAFRIMYIHQ